MGDSSGAGSSVPRVGLIGLGRIGSAVDEGRAEVTLSHAAAYENVLGRAVVAAADPDGGSRARFARARGVSAVYADYLDMFESESLDVVSLCTPSTVRREVIEQAIACGVRAILCEKPLAATPGEAEAIRDHVSASGIQLVVNYTRRWDPVVVRLRESLRAGRIGEVQAVTGWYTKGIIHNGTHWLDLVNYLLTGAPQPVRVLGRVADDMEVHGNATVHAQLSLSLNGRTIPVFIHGADHRSYAIFEVEILGTMGSVALKDLGRRLIVRTAGPDTEFADAVTLGDEERSAGVDFSAALRGAVEETLAGLEGPTTSGRDSIESAVEALRTAACLAGMELNESNGN